MQLEEFKGLALRTESQIDGISLDRDKIVILLTILVELVGILDGLKKAVFYKKVSKLDSEFIGHLIKMGELIAELRASSDNTEQPASEMLFSSNGDYLHGIDPRVFHGILGIITESGELAEALLKVMRGEVDEIDPINIQEEMSDIAWYKAILHDVLKLNWGQGLRNVIEKLNIRYPEKFSDYFADNRDLDAERAALSVGFETKPTLMQQLAAQEGDEDAVDESDLMAIEELEHFRQRLNRSLGIGDQLDLFESTETTRLEKQRELLDDAMVIYRLGRVPSPEDATRKVFFVEVPDGLTPEEAKELVAKFMDEKRG